MAMARMTTRSAGEVGRSRFRPPGASCANVSSNETSSLSRSKMNDNFRQNLRNHPEPLILKLLELSPTKS